jgi:hypothetical protein
LFSRDEKSKEIARRLFKAENIDVQFVESVESSTLEFKKRAVILSAWGMYHKDGPPMLSHFKTYRGHLMFIRKQMDEWKPRTMHELLQPAYRDRFAWYASMFGAFIAIVGTVAGISGIVSAVTGYIAMKASLQQLNLQPN